MIFTNPHWLWALALLPLVLFFEWRAVVRARRATIALAGPRANHPLLAQALPWSRRAGLALRTAAIAALLLGAAGPQWGRETVKHESRGSDVMFVLDVSASMDARDVPPSRMDEARREALGLLERIPGSRVGVVLFAGEAARVCPLTLDHSAVRLVLESTNSAALSEPGTDLREGLERALGAFGAGRREEQGIVLWTDGEDLEGGSKDVIERMRRSGVRVFAVGVGTPAGDVVPEFDEEGRAVDVKRDERGEVVRSKLDDATLRELARATHGAYFGAARVGGELQRLAGLVGSLAQARRGTRLVERPVARFGWFALAAAALLAVDFARARSRRAAAGAGAGPGAKRATQKQARTTVGAAAAVLLLLAPWPAAHAQSAWARGDRAFRDGRWSAAESLYAQRAKRGGPAKVRVNLATAQAMNGRGEAAELALSRLAADSGRVGRAAGYNLGTVLGKRKEYDRALQELRRVLERDPNDADARWNYEMLKREKEKSAGQQSPKPDEQQPDPQPQPAASGAKQPQGQGAAPQPPPGTSQPPPPQQGPGGAAGMTKQQAEALLGSLQELERIDRQRAQRAQGGGRRKGKDW
ncbi:MAG: VWA domain-containing protein [Candidatus Eisenbacteria bacterium]|uniref:VWA domain-containing protein n=1 Tax=Eiseniibacteriota bacterium TaxID=2212470 RepID=A0A933SAU1_UNCEI|nr:VWA domain-containing protein [Candidatus Eisenbacteria bacterium]